MEGITDTDRRCDSSITTYVIGLSRLFKLLPSTRTTLVTRNEEMQILQYCVAVHSKMISGKFDASPKLCEKLHSDMLHRRISDFEKKMDREFFNKKEKCEQSDADQSVSNEQTSNLDKVCVRGLQTSDLKLQQEKTGSVKGDDEADTSNKDSPVRKELDDAKTENIECDNGDSSVLSLFVENLISSNHCTLLDVFEKFLNEVINEKTNLHTFAKSNFKMNVAVVGDLLSLRRVEVLTIKVLKSIAGIDDDDDKPCSQSSQSTRMVETGRNNTDDLFQLPQNLMMSPSSTRMKDTPKRLRIQKTPKTPVDVFRSQHQFSPLSSTPITPRTDVERQEIQKKFVENIIRCYLHLLVNTRCEMALAFVFNIPARELDHEAFTHLKHESASFGLSMFQTLSTLLTRIRLGGQAYAPPSDSPLMFYVKGLGNLFDFIDKLQTIIEESASPRSACKRVVNILKRSVSTCKSNKFPHAVVEDVSNRLWDRLDDILAVMEKGDKEDSSEKSVSEGGSISGQSSIDAIQKYLDQSAASVSDVDRYFLGDVRFSQDTPTRFPCLMSQFRSPLTYAVDEENEEEDLKDGNGMETNAGSMMRQSSFPASEALYLDSCDNDNVVCTPLDLNNVYVIPSKTIVHPKCGADYFGPADGGEDHLLSPGTGKSKNVPKAKGQRKRPGPSKQQKKDVLSKVGDRENQPNAENSPEPKSLKTGDTDTQLARDKSDGADAEQRNVVKGSVNKKQSKSCRRKLLPQIKGQSKLTGFFKL